jgi:hypothetical protein
MPRSFLPRVLVVVLALAVPLTGCKSRTDKAIAPPDSYVLFVPDEGKAEQSGLQVRRADVKTEAVQPIPALLETGFASEMLRTVYLAGQYLRDATVDGRTFPEPARANGSLPVCLVVGADKLPYARGLTIKGGFLGGPTSWPGQPWLGIPAKPASDKALIQTLTARFAAYAAHLVATGGLLDKAPTPPSQTLIDGYRMAMEVVAREWRFRPGPDGVIQMNQGTPEQRALFGNVRDNRYVIDESGKALRGAQEMLDSPGVAATTLHRMAQSHTVGTRVASEAFYAPYAKNRMPPGISPAAIQVYGEAFPKERFEVIRIFVVTTYGATVMPGGCSMDPKDSQRTLAELTALSLEVAEGHKTLHEAVGKQDSALQGGKPRDSQGKKAP